MKKIQHKRRKKMFINKNSYEPKLVCTQPVIQINQKDRDELSSLLLSKLSTEKEFRDKGFDIILNYPISYFAESLYPYKNDNCKYNIAHISHLKSTRFNDVNFDIVFMKDGVIHTVVKYICDRPANEIDKLRYEYDEYMNNIDDVPFPDYDNFQHYLDEAKTNTEIIFTTENMDTEETMVYTMPCMYKGSFNRFIRNELREKIPVYTISADEIDDLLVGGFDYAINTVVNNLLNELNTRGLNLPSMLVNIKDCGVSAVELVNHNLLTPHGYNENFNEGITYENCYFTEYAKAIGMIYVYRPTSNIKTGYYIRIYSLKPYFDYSLRNIDEWARNDLDVSNNGVDNVRDLLHMPLNEFFTPSKYEFLQYKIDGINSYFGYIEKNSEKRIDPVHTVLDFLILIHRLRQLEPPYEYNETKLANHFLYAFLTEFFLSNPVNKENDEKRKSTNKILPVKERAKLIKMINPLDLTSEACRNNPITKLHPSNYLKALGLLCESSYMKYLNDTILNNDTDYKEDKYSLCEYIGQKWEAGHDDILYKLLIDTACIYHNKINIMR